MKRLLPLLLVVLAACREHPLVADQRSDFQLSMVERSGAFTTVSARPQLVSLAFIPGGQTAEVTVKARFTASTDPTAQIDGAILVVSANDGPMPVIGGSSLAIEITGAVIDESGTVRFDGLATVSNGRVVLDRFAITGSTQAAVGRDYIVWDIVGGNNTWEVRFSALTKVSA